MNCRFCGTTLPSGALFCGECGRSVASTANNVAVSRERAGMPSSIASSAAASDPAPAGVTLVESEFSCPQCGEPIAEDDVFCGACGFVLASSYLSAPVDALGDPVSEEPASEVAVLAEALPVAEPVIDAPAPRDSAPAPHDSVPTPVADPGPVAASAPNIESAPATPPRTLRATPDPFPWGKDPRLPTVDLESTRISAAPPAEERFVLQFSTGESVTVSGAGLVGRNPASQPGEFVDQLVSIFDAGKSVSKTHLEFGQDSGRFWVSDRFSTNGSTVRQPDLEPKRCEPGRRYFVARGTRIDIGDQFFIVS